MIKDDQYVFLQTPNAYELRQTIRVLYKYYAIHCVAMEHPTITGKRLYIGSASCKHSHVWVDGDPNAVGIKQVLVCCKHPMAVYYQHAKGVGVGKHMDRAIRIACELAGLHINLNYTYFELWKATGG
jgi:hypothetical protein